MHKLIYNTIFTLFGLFFTLASLAQDSTGTKKPEMATLMRSNGKIYVVVTVLVIILLGLILYVTRLDRKISRLEKDTSVK